MEKPKEERRFTVRLSNSVVVSYYVASDKFLKSSSRSSNVSQSGIRLSLSQGLDKDTIWDFEINFDEFPKSILVTGQVIWVRRVNNPRFPFEVGIKFLKVGEQEKAKIKQVIMQLAQDQGYGHIKWLEE
jgi:c-di-GMP-binding flagellar brake protein YcgR